MAFTCMVQLLLKPKTKTQCSRFQRIILSPRLMPQTLKWSIGPPMYNILRDDGMLLPPWLCTAADRIEKSSLERCPCVKSVWYSLLSPHENRMLYFHDKPMSEDSEENLVSVSWRLREIDNGVWLKAEKSKVKKVQQIHWGSMHFHSHWLMRTKWDTLQKWAGPGHLKRQSLLKGHQSGLWYIKKRWIAAGSEQSYPEEGMPRAKEFNWWSWMRISKEQKCLSEEKSAMLASTVRRALSQTAL